MSTTQPADARGVRLVAPFRVSAFHLGPDSVSVTGVADDVDVTIEADEVIVATGEAASNTAADSRGR